MIDLQKRQYVTLETLTISKARVYIINPPASQLNSTQKRATKKHEWSSVDEFEKELHSYIHYYNYDRHRGDAYRIKLRLKGKSPVQYRTLYQ